jgi:hypothetical protein
MINPIHYSIRVKGHLPAGWSALFEGLQIECLPDGDSLLSGPVIDQAALYGLLARLQSLGLSLISINRVENTTLNRAGFDLPGDDQ